jgi:HlyD family secretion protein
VRTKRKLRTLVTIILVLAVAAAGYHYLGPSDTQPGEDYLTVPVSRGEVSRTVSSTGLLQAVVTVQVGSQVSGRIKELHADFNSVVKKDQTLAIIDPANFEAQLERAKASLATAKATVKSAAANLINRKAELESARANVEVGEVNLKEAERELKRSHELYEAEVISDRDLETAQALFDQAKARLSQNRAQVSQVEASIRSAHAQNDQAAANVQEATASLKMADVNLRYTTITSPIDGVVIERNVDIGQTVAASFQAPVLFLIANDLTKMQVIAQIDEADIGAISEMAEVDFAVDAFPGQTFEGKISEIRLSSKLPNSDTQGGSQSGGGATNVVVYNVIIDVENMQLKLRPAMTANVNFVVARESDVLTVANSALRFRPAGMSPEEIRALMRGGGGRRPPGTGSSTAMAGPGPDRAGLSEAAADGDRPERGRWGRDPGERRRGPRGGGEEMSHAEVGISTIEQYGIRPGPKIRFPRAERTRPRPGLLWVLDENAEPQPRRVLLGITDGRETAILRGDLEEGEEIITWKLDESGQVQRGSTSPFSGAFGPRRSRSTSSRGGARGGGTGTRGGGTGSRGR